MYHFSLISKWIIKNNLQNNNLFKVFEEPEEPIPEEEVPEELPIVEEVEEVAPPTGTADFMDWTFVRSLSQKSSKPNIHQYTLLTSYQ